MLNIGNDHDRASDKCYFTQCALPQYIDQSQPPTKRKPFSTILEHPFNHTVRYTQNVIYHILTLPQLDLLLPKSAFQAIQDDLSGDHYRLQYAKVHLKLKDIIDGDFFNQYIKTGMYGVFDYLLLLRSVGNIMMLSEGTPGVDNTYSLCEGNYEHAMHRTLFVLMLYRHPETRARQANI